MRRIGTGVLTAIATLTAATVLLAAPEARACAVCFDLADRAREAYYGTTVLLMLVPFAFLGGILYWLRRAARRQAAARETGASPVKTPRI